MGGGSTGSQQMTQVTPNDPDLANCTLVVGVAVCGPAVTVGGADPV